MGQAQTRTPDLRSMMWVADGAAAAEDEADRHKRIMAVQ
jgi:hypothetical protein